MRNKDFINVVIRCKDCIHRQTRECPMCYTEDYFDEDLGYDYVFRDRTLDNSFATGESQMKKQFIIKTTLLFWMHNKKEKRMISKNKFMDFVSRVERTEKGIVKIEKAFGDYCFREEDFCALQNYASDIAFTLFDFNEEHENFLESFTTDFWNMVDEGHSEFSMFLENGTKEVEVKLTCWEEFYDFWVKERERANDT